MKRLLTAPFELASRLASSFASAVLALLTYAFSNFFIVFGLGAFIIYMAVLHFFR